MKRRQVLAAGVLAAMTIFCSGCLGGTGSGSGTSHEETLDEQVDRIVSSMSTTEKVGQMVMIGIQGQDVNDDSLYMLHQYHMGGVILFDRNMVSAEQVTALTEHLQAQADEKVPLFIGIDEEGGDVVRGKEALTPPPSQQEIGAGGEVTKAEEWAAKTAVSLKKLGINVNFAPVADVGSPDRRSYSADPDQVTKFVQAAAQGYARAQYDLGWMYANGRGVAQNYAKAFEWYSKAAAQGDASAQTNLGSMYENGQGIARNPALANEWYLKAANNGSAMAQFNIGQHYLHGSNGLPKNRVQALNWLKKAANNGHAQAKLILAGLQ